MEYIKARIRFSSRRDFGIEKSVIIIVPADHYEFFDYIKSLLQDNIYNHQWRSSEISVLVNFTQMNDVDFKIQELNRKFNGELRFPPTIVFDTKSKEDDVKKCLIDVIELVQGKIASYQSEDETLFDDTED